MELKKSPTLDKCAAARCRLRPAEVHTLDQALAFCPKHAAEARLEYQELGISPKISPVESEAAGLLSLEQREKMALDQAAFDSLLAELASFEVNATEEVAFAEGELLSAQAQEKAYSAQLNSILKPQKEAMDNARALFRPVLVSLEALIKAWKEVLKRHRLRADAETKRQLAIAAESRQPEVIQTAMIGAAEAAPKTQAVTFRPRFRFEVENADLLPDEYWMPDLDKIGRVVTSLGEDCQIPGVRVWSDPVVMGPRK